MLNRVDFITATVEGFNSKRRLKKALQHSSMLTDTKLGQWPFMLISVTDLNQAMHISIFFLHPAGDVTRVFVVTGKVTVKIGDAKNWWRGCRDKNQLKKAKIPVCLVLSRVPFKSGV